MPKPSRTTRYAPTIQSGRLDSEAAAKRFILRPSVEIASSPHHCLRGPGPHDDDGGAVGLRNRRSPWIADVRSRLGPAFDQPIVRFAQLNGRSFCRLPRADDCVPRGCGRPAPGCDHGPHDCRGSHDCPCRLRPSVPVRWAMLSRRRAMPRPPLRTRERAGSLRWLGYQTSPRVPRLPARTGSYSGHSTRPTVAKQTSLGVATQGTPQGRRSNTASQKTSGLDAITCQPFLRWRRGGFGCPRTACRWPRRAWSRSARACWSRRRDRRSWDRNPP